jgi:peptidoglycan/xylan/chitin deacetylase (PgdA/CDA1 family)
MRPPYGHQDLRTHRIARRLGYRPVFWSVAGEDWRGHDAATIAERILAGAAPGAIVLLHDSLFAWEEAGFRDRTACFAAVETVLGRLSDYRFVTVSELLARGAARQRYWVQLPDRGDMARLRLAEGQAG